jgi:hypothetical protein
MEQPIVRRVRDQASVLALFVTIAATTTPAFAGSPKPATATTSSKKTTPSGGKSAKTATGASTAKPATTPASAPTPPKTTAAPAPAKTTPAPAPAKALPDAVLAMVKDFTQRAVEAEKKGENGEAVQLLRAAAELDPQDADVSTQLADAWNLAFEYDAAVSEYQRALTLVTDPGRRADIQGEIDRLTSSERPLEEGRADSLPPLTDDAKKTFALGESLRESGDDGNAIQAYQASLLLDDSLPGPYRALGGEYEKVGDTANERQFFARYLAMRSTGPIADDIRSRLAKEGALGTLDVTSSFPCELWLNDQDLGSKTPLQGFKIPEGPFKITCDLTDSLHSAFSQHKSMKAGDTVDVSFGVGVIHVALDPWARVSVDGMDVGLYDDTAITAGHHTIELVAHDGSHTKKVDVDLTAGQTYSISSW